MLYCSTYSILKGFYYYNIFTRRNSQRIYLFSVKKIVWILLKFIAVFVSLLSITSSVELNFWNFLFLFSWAYPVSLFWSVPIETFELSSCYFLLDINDDIYVMNILWNDYIHSYKRLKKRECYNAKDSLALRYSLVKRTFFSLL